MHWEDMTSEDALRTWDACELVWTGSMGGMGPGYEQCIQVMGFEMLRAMLKNPPTDWASFNDSAEGTSAWLAYRKAVEDDPIVKACVRAMRPSGAQFCAAMNLASVFARNGYAKGMAMLPDDRRMMVSRNFPAFDHTTVQQIDDRTNASGSTPSA